MSEASPTLSPRLMRDMRRIAGKQPAAAPSRPGSSAGAGSKEPAASSSDPTATQIIKDRPIGEKDPNTGRIVAKVSVKDAAALVDAEKQLRVKVSDDEQQALTEAESADPTNDRKYKPSFYGPEGSVQDRSAATAAEQTEKLSPADERDALYIDTAGRGLKDIRRGRDLEYVPLYQSREVLTYAVDQWGNALPQRFSREIAPPSKNADGVTEHEFAGKALPIPNEVGFLGRKATAPPEGRPGQLTITRVGKVITEGGTDRLIHERDGSGLRQYDVEFSHDKDFTISADAIRDNLTLITPWGKRILVNADKLTVISETGAVRVYDTIQNPIRRVPGTADGQDTYQIIADIPPEVDDLDLGLDRGNIDSKRLWYIHPYPNGNEEPRAIEHVSANGTIKKDGRRPHDSQRSGLPPHPEPIPNVPIPYGALHLLADQPQDGFHGFRYNSSLGPVRVKVGEEAFFRVVEGNFGKDDEGNSIRRSERSMAFEPMRMENFRRDRQGRLPTDFLYGTGLTFQEFAQRDRIMKQFAKQAEQYKLTPIEPAKLEQYFATIDTWRQTYGQQIDQAALQKYLDQTLGLSPAQLRSLRAAEQEARAWINPGGLGKFEGVEIAIRKMQDIDPKRLLAEDTLVAGRPSYKSNDPRFGIYEPSVLQQLNALVKKGPQARFFDTTTGLDVWGQDRSNPFFCIAERTKFISPPVEPGGPVPPSVTPLDLTKLDGNPASTEITERPMFYLSMIVTDQKGEKRQKAPTTGSTTTAATSGPRKLTVEESF